MLEKRKIDCELEETEDWFRERQCRQAAAEAVERQKTEGKQRARARLGRERVLDGQHGKLR